MRLFVVMGVSGCGKSTIASALASATSGEAIDGDDFHPPANISKMSAGIALTDDDRWPWLDRVAEEMRDRKGLVFCACSALRRSYRDRIRTTIGEPVTFLHLKGSKELIAQRMNSRPGHFMPASLLDSQFETLEIPAADEDAITVDIAASEADVVAFLLEAINAASAKGRSRDDETGAR